MTGGLFGGKYHSVWGLIRDLVLTVGVGTLVVLFVRETSRRATVREQGREQRTLDQKAELVERLKADAVRFVPPGATDVSFGPTEVTKGSLTFCLSLEGRPVRFVLVFRRPLNGSADLICLLARAD